MDLMNFGFMGIFFTCCALWWIQQAWKTYYWSLHVDGRPYQSHPTWKLNLGKCGWTDLNASFIVLATTAGILIQLVVIPMIENNTAYEEFYYATVYAFFLLVGAFALVLPKCGVFPNHEAIVYCMLSLAFAIELIFQVYVVDVEVELGAMYNLFLAYTIAACLLCTLVEMRFKHNVVAALSRGYVTLVLGAWQLHGALLVSNITDALNALKNNAMSESTSDDLDGFPNNTSDIADTNETVMSNVETISSNMFTTLSTQLSSTGESPHHEDTHTVLVFSWYIAGALSAVFLLGLMTGCCHKCSGRLDDGKMLQEQNPEGKGYAFISIDGNEDD